LFITTDIVKTITLFELANQLHPLLLITNEMLCYGFQLLNYVQSGGFSLTQKITIQTNMA